MNMRMPFALFALGMAAAACSSNDKSSTGPNPPPDTTTHTFTAALTSAAVRPSGDTAIHGTGVATITLRGDTVHYTISDTGLTSAVTALSINGPADTGAVAASVYAIPLGAGSPWSGTFATTTLAGMGADSLLAWAQAGRLYLTMADSAHAGGVLRGQITTNTGAAGPATPTGTGY